jgi:hypothetical protein
VAVELLPAVQPDPVVHPAPVEMVAERPQTVETQPLTALVAVAPVAFSQGLVEPEPVELSLFDGACRSPTPVRIL